MCPTLLSTLCNSVLIEGPAHCQVLLIPLGVHPAGRFDAFFSRCQHWSCVRLGWTLLQWGQVVAFLHFSIQRCRTCGLCCGWSFGRGCYCCGCIGRRFVCLMVAVSCCNVSLFALMSASICFECFSVNSATNSSAA